MNMPDPRLLTSCHIHCVSMTKTHIYVPFIYENQVHDSAIFQGSL